MRKINLELTLKVGLIALCVFNIFASFFPMLSFNFTIDNVSKKYALDGMSLLVNESKAMYWDMYDAYVFEGLTFSKSPTFISAFSLNIMLLTLCGFSLLIKSKFNLDKFIFPLISILAITNVICSSMVFSMFDKGEIDFFMDYGLIIFIVFSALELLVSVSINIVLFYDKKKKQD